MAKLGAVVESLDTVAEPYRELYTEVEGKFVLDADIEGHPAVAGLKSALDKERRLAKDALAKAKAAGDPAELDRLRTELEGLRQHDKPDLEKVVEKRVKAVRDEFAPITEKLAVVEAENRRLKLDEKVKAAALKAGVIPEDVEDVLVISKRHFDLDSNGKIAVTDDDGDPTGKTPEQWFADVFKQRKPKFFVGSNASGTGARGSGAGGDGTVTLTPDQASDYATYQAALKTAGGDHAKVRIAPIA